MVCEVATGMGACGRNSYDFGESTVITRDFFVLQHLEHNFMTFSDGCRMFGANYTDSVDKVLGNKAKGVSNSD